MTGSSGLARAATAAALALCAASPALAGTPRFAGPTIANPSTPPNFALRDQHGQVIELASQRGRVVLLTFLCTHCRTSVR